uniref:Fibronectin type-III domain-containing protein n=1 Tax=Hippocampus comes TaxID=109280 RepID=A0A3Q2YUQ4_HIPCM
VYSCSSGMVTVTWDLVFGANLYRATAVDGTGASLNCTSASDSCQVTMLKCGEQYRVHVTAISDDCESIANTSTVDIFICPAPCAPQNLEAMTDCSTHSIWASWNASSGATSYTATMTGPNGFFETCSTSNLMCSFSNLQCATQYSVNVTAHDDYCTRPCDPLNVTAVLQCGSDAATVSWHASAGAASYHVLAYASQHQTSCWSMSTSCQLNGLQCGATYNLTVVAEGSTCNSTGGSQATLMTAITKTECVTDTDVKETPQYLQIKLRAQDMAGEGGVFNRLFIYYCQDMPTVRTAVATLVCFNHSALVAADGASSYSVWAGNDQGWIATCNSTETSCHLSGLRCGQIYNVTVTAHNHGCDSFTSDAHRFMTEPCPPTNVLADMECEQLAVTISWDQSALAQGYVAYVYDHAGHYVLMCEAEGTTASCAVSGLMCGTQYDMWVVALGEEYNSSDSTTVMFTSGTDIATVTQAALPLSKHVRSHDSRPHTVADMISFESCCDNCQYIFKMVKCFFFFSVHVSHLITMLGCICDCVCIPPPSAAPCIPRDVMTHEQCGANAAAVYWRASDGAITYAAEAIGLDGHSHWCYSNHSNCTWDDLHCGDEYTVLVMAEDEDCASLPSNSSVIYMGIHIEIKVHFIQQVFPREP